MTPKSAVGLVPGDYVEALPLWNLTERPARQLPRPSIVWGIEVTSGCQSGVLITVRDKGGELVSLDAAWFEEPASAARPTPEAKERT